MGEGGTRGQGDKGTRRQGDKATRGQGDDLGDNFFLLPITYYLFPMPNT
ncbi:hypothetical protein [Tolypothrix sp. VBCCA 56010]